MHAVVCLVGADDEIPPDDPLGQDRLEDRLFEAFATGDAGETARVLRQLPGLGRVELCAMADLFDGGLPDDPTRDFESPKLR